jgi:hypothetical protein
MKSGTAYPTGKIFEDAGIGVGVFKGYVLVFE